MKKHANYIVASFLILTATAMAGGSIIDYVTPSGSTAGGNPVSAEAVFTTSTDVIEILLKNLFADPRSVGQNLSGLSFTITTGQDSGTISSSYGTERTVKRGGSFTDSGTVSTGWSLSSSGGGLELNVLGTLIGPAHTILGPPGGSTYSNANRSIAGNGPHNPFLGGSARFFLSVPGITAQSTINSVAFSFGTTAGVDVMGSMDFEPPPDMVPGCNNVPEPATIFILSLGGLALLRRRK